MNHTLEKLLPIVREVYHNAEIFRGRIVKSPVNEYILTVPESHVVDPHDWNFLMPLAIKLKITITPRVSNRTDMPDYWWVHGVRSKFHKCHTESEIKDAVIECALAIVGGE